MRNKDDTTIVIIVIFIAAILALYFISKILFVLGIIFAVIGGEGIHFFENNPTGKNLLDAANTVVNSTKDIIKK